MQQKDAWLQRKKLKTTSQQTTFLQMELCMLARWVNLQQLHVLSHIFHRVIIAGQLSKHVLHRNLNTGSPPRVNSILEYFTAGVIGTKVYLIDATQVLMAIDGEPATVSVEVYDTVSNNATVIIDKANEMLRFESTW